MYMYIVICIMYYQLSLLFPSGGVSVLKAQVLAGGRGLGKFNSGLQGGVQIVNS